MKRRRLWGLGFLAMALVAPSSGPATAQAPPALGAVTTVEGTGPGSMLVTIPAPAHISPAILNNKDITVEGSGRYVGIALVAEGFEERIGPTLIAGRIPPRALCDDTGCPYGIATPFAGIDLEYNRLDEGVLTLPPGDYRLHLITESSAGPVSVTLRFDGLTGEQVFQPSESSGLKTLPLPPRLPSASPTQSVYWGGGAHDIGARSRGIMWSMAWFRHPAEPEGTYRYCTFRNADPGDYPGCPTAEWEMAITGGIAGYPVKAWILMEGFGFPVQGNWGQKLWYAADLTDGLDGIALWLPFGDVPTELPGHGAALSVTWFPVLAVEGPRGVPENVTEARCVPQRCSDTEPVLVGRERAAS
ncbi:MAG TPA: hypothetical protein VG602_07835 [Actinomycetota bacterium]|nr:hypothetical protein [Actinomycetota bacterium]